MIVEYLHRLSIKQFLLKRVTSKPILPSDGKRETNTFEFFIVLLSLHSPVIHHLKYFTPISLHNFLLAPNPWLLQVDTVEQLGSSELVLLHMKMFLMTHRNV